MVQAGRGWRLSPRSQEWGVGPGPGPGDCWPRAGQQGGLVEFQSKQRFPRAEGMCPATVAVKPAACRSSLSESLWRSPPPLPRAPHDPLWARITGGTPLCRPQGLCGSAAICVGPPGRSSSSPGTSRISGLGGRAAEPPPRLTALLSFHSLTKDHRKRPKYNKLLVSTRSSQPPPLHAWGLGWTRGKAAPALRATLGPPGTQLHQALRDAGGGRGFLVQGCHGED